MEAGVPRLNALLAAAAYLLIVGKIEWVQLQAVLALLHPVYIPRLLLSGIAATASVPADGFS